MKSPCCHDHMDELDSTVIDVENQYQLKQSITYVELNLACEGCAKGYLVAGTIETKEVIYWDTLKEEVQA